MTERELRAYLLGQVTGPEAERIEVRLLEDQEVFDTLRGVEDDLIDEYARGTLMPAERQQFIERYGDARARVLVAHALASRHESLAAQPRRTRGWMPAAAAAALVVLAGGITMWMRSEPVAPPPVVLAPAPRAPVAAVLTIALGASRAEAAIPEVTLQKETTVVELRVRLNPADRFDAYSMELRSAAGASVWTADKLGATVENGNLLLSGRIPAAALPDGSYELAVRSSDQEPLGYATLRVRR